MRFDKEVKAMQPIHVCIGEHAAMRVMRLIPALALCPLVLGACAMGPRTAFTQTDQAAAVPLSARTIRFWANSPGSLFQKAARAAV